LPESTEYNRAAKILRYRRSGNNTGDLPANMNVSAEGLWDESMLFTDAAE